jgi:hypothetical protein
VPQQLLSHLLPPPARVSGPGSWAAPSDAASRGAGRWSSGQEKELEPGAEWESCFPDPLHCSGRPASRRNGAALMPTAQIFIGVDGKSGAIAAGATNLVSLPGSDMQQRVAVRVHRSLTRRR